MTKKVIVCSIGVALLAIAVASFYFPSLGEFLESRPEQMIVSFVLIVCAASMLHLKPVVHSAADAIPQAQRSAPIPEAKPVVHVVTPATRAREVISEVPVSAPPEVVLLHAKTKNGKPFPYLYQIERADPGNPAKKTFLGVISGEVRRDGTQYVFFGANGKEFPSDAKNRDREAYKALQHLQAS